MSTENMILSTSWPADENLSAAQYHAVRVNGARVALCGPAHIPVGILQNNPHAAGVAAEVGLIGISKAVVDGATTNVGIGDFLAVNASGRLVRAGTSRQPVVGRALEPVTANGIVARVLLDPMNTFNLS